MPRKLAEYQRAVSRVQNLRDRKKITPQTAAQMIEKARLKLQTWAMRFEQRR